MGEMPPSAPVVPSWIFLDECAFSIKEVFEDLRLKCPYRFFLLSKGLDMDADQGPDWPDLYAHQAALMAYGMQDKNQSHLSTKRSIVPLGLDPQTHLQLAMTAGNPLCAETPLALDLQFAIQTVCKHKGNTDVWRSQQWQILETAEHRLEELQLLHDRRRTFQSRQVSSHVKIHTLAASSYSIQWPDNKLPWDYCHGFQCPVGELDTYGIFRSKRKVASLILDELDDSAPDWLERILLFPPPPDEEASVAYNKTLQEQQKRHCGPFLYVEELDQKYGVGGWRASMRFALWQANHEFWQVIDNGKGSRKNDTLSTKETIHTTNNHVGMAI